MNMNITNEHLLWLLVAVIILQVILIFIIRNKGYNCIKTDSVSFIISCISFVISVIALTKTGKCDGDILVGTLSSIVAILIGWQIWKSVEWVKKFEEIDKLEIAHNFFVSNSTRETHDDIAEIALTTLGKGLHNNIYYIYICHKMKALTAGSIVKDYLYCSNCVNDIIQFIKKNDFAINKYEKESLLNLFKGVRNKENIDDVDNLYNTIKELSEIPM